jgi:hypothetical protein
VEDKVVVSRRQWGRALGQAALVVGLVVGCEGGDACSGVLGSGGGDDDDGNRPPAEPIVSIYPDLPKGNETLKASVDNFNDDPDGDSLLYSYDWYREGDLLDDISGALVDPSWTKRGEHWTVEVWADDGDYLEGPGTATTVVGNTPPDAPGDVRVEPDDPVAGGPLSCIGVLINPDADGDEVWAEYLWHLDGSPTPALWESLPLDFTTSGEQWICEMIASDGMDDVSTFSDPVDIP